MLLQGVVTYTSPVEAFATGSRILIGENRPWSLDRSVPRLLIAIDGIISCTCCGEGLLEIKCPYKHRNTPPSEVQDPSFCLQCGIDSQLRLPQTHKYYSQVQGQLSVCDKEFCDFAGRQREFISRELPMIPPFLMASGLRSTASLKRLYYHAYYVDQKHSSQTRKTSHWIVPTKTTKESEQVYCWCQEPE